MCNVALDGFVHAMRRDNFNSLYTTKGAHLLDSIAVAQTKDLLSNGSFMELTSHIFILLLFLLSKQMKNEWYLMCLKNPR